MLAARQWEPVSGPDVTEAAHGGKDTVSHCLEHFTELAEGLAVTASAEGGAGV